MNLEQLKQMLKEGKITQEVYLSLLQQAQVNVSESEVGGSINMGEMNVGGDFVGQNKIVNNYYYGEPTEDPAETLKIYCRMLAYQCVDLSLQGLDIYEGNVGNKNKTMNLTQIYVSLDTTTIIGYEDNSLSILQEKNRGIRPLSVLQAVQKEQKLVLLGDPGGGKSTFVFHLAYCLAVHHLYPAEKWLDHLPGWTEKNRQMIPSLVIMRDFAQFEPEGKLDATSPERLWQFIIHHLYNMGIEFTQKMLKEKFHRGEVVLLLDGIDEVTTPEQRWQIKQILTGFITLYPQNRYVLTCRILSYQAPTKRGEKELRLTNLPTFTLAPFNEEKIDQFITTWYTNMATNRTLEEPEQKIKLLKEAIRQRDIRRVVENPLLLTILALVHTHKGGLPSARALLYEECVEMLLWRWEQVQSEKLLPLREWLKLANLKETHLKQLLWELAYQTHAQGSKGEGLAGIPELTLRKGIEALNEEDVKGALQLIELMKLRTGLLLEREVAVFTFPHRTFQEYLAGVYLSTQPNFVELADELATEQWELWREVIKLAVGRLMYGIGMIDKCEMLVKFLITKSKNQPIEPTVYWRKVWLAGELLVEMGLEWVKIHKIWQKRLYEVREKLQQLVSTGQLESNERLLVGEMLGKIGDKRLGVGVFKMGEIELPDFEFCYIPPGPFWMGSAEDDTESENNEKPLHQVEIPYGYWLSKYPVTVGQYRVFVQTTGQELTVRYSLQGLPNQPVSYVTWYESLKFCAWLTEVSQTQGWLPEGYRMILPSEAEWEKGARGGLNLPIIPLSSQRLLNGLVEPSFQLQEQEHPLWRYPWGNEFDMDCALTKETKFNSRGVIGAYPRGESVYGLGDMSGNVWEWTRSIWGKDFDKSDFGYPYQFDDGREELDRPDNDQWLRVFRGGAYYSRIKNTCSSFRYRYDPDRRNDYFGFRVCVSRFPI